MNAERGHGSDAGLGELVRSMVMLWSQESGGHVSEVLAANPEGATPRNGQVVIRYPPPGGLRG